MPYRFLTLLCFILDSCPHLHRVTLDHYMRLYMCLHYIRLLPMGEWLFECVASHRIFALRCILLLVRASHQIVASLLFLQYTASRQIQVREKKNKKKEKEALLGFGPIWPFFLVSFFIFLFLFFFFFFLNSTPNACCGCF
jgi:quinol-cytochrome oxidoreductase complex cytochrome b subunit